MKVRNFMYATMIACAFASCSKDDVIENGPDAAKAGSITISVGTATNKTKTLAEDEVKLNTLGLYLYKGATLVASNTSLTSPTGEATWTINDLEAGDYTCYGYANMPAFAENAKPNDPQSIVVKVTGEVEADNLPMSGLGTATLTASGQETLEVKLVRNVARIDLTSVGLGMGWRNLVKYPDGGDASFALESVSINNVPTSFLGDNKMATTDPMAYWGGEAYNFGTQELKGFYLKSASATVAQKYDASIGKDLTKDVKYASNFTTVSFYVLPNTSNRETTLLLKGAFTNGGQAAADGWYPIVVGSTDENGNNVTDYSIAANTIYDITAIIAGPGTGSDGGDKPSFLVKTKVAPWNTVKQVAPVQ